MKTTPLPLTQEKLEELKLRLKKEKNAKNLKRIQAIYALAMGKSVQTIANELQISRKRIPVWRKQYEQGGIEALMAKKSPGRPRNLLDCYETSVKNDIVNQPNHQGYPFFNWTLKRIIMHLKQKYHTDYSLTGVWRLTRRLNIRRKVTRTIYKESDPKLKKIS